MAAIDNALIQVNDLKKHYPVTKGAITKTLVGTVKAIDGVSFYFGRQGQDSTSKSVWWYS